MTYTDVVFTFIETPLFTKLVTDYPSDEEYTELQAFLADNPEAGAVIRGSGGVRKIRWAIKGRGKRGGLRVIYYLRLQKSEFWMLTLYPKNVADSIPANVLRKILKEIEDD